MIKNFIQGNIFFAFCLISLLLFIIFFGTRAGFRNANSDFPNYYVSAKMLLNGTLDNAYKINEFNVEIKKLNPNAQGLFVMYPPATSIIMLPLLSYNLLEAKKIWVIISSIFIALILYLLIYSLGINKWHSFFIIAGAGFNLVNDLMLGQVYIFTVLFTTIAIILILRNKQITPGILLGVIASLKLFPLLFVPFFIFKKKYKLAFTLLGSFFMMNLCVFFLCGEDVFNSFFEAFKINYFQNKVAGITPISIQYQSLEAFKNIVIFSNSFSDFTKQSVLFISKIWAPFWAIILGTILILKRNSKHFLEISLSCILLFLLITEVGSASYHMLLIIPVLTLIFYTNLIGSKNQMALLFLWFIIGFFPTIYLKLSIENLFLDFNRLWLLTIFCLVVFTGFYNSNKNLN